MEYDRYSTTSSDGGKKIVTKSTTVMPVSLFWMIFFCFKKNYHDGTFCLYLVESVHKEIQCVFVVIHHLNIFILPYSLSLSLSLFLASTSSIFLYLLPLSFLLFDFFYSNLYFQKRKHFLTVFFSFLKTFFYISFFNLVSLPFIVRPEFGSIAASRYARRMDNNKA